MHQLSFSTLREANRARLPLFKNGLGDPAHSKPDGSDWSPAQWLQAMIGEIGEWAQIRIDFEEGKIGFEEYRDKCRKELADVQTYFDLLCSRALDKVVDPSDHGGISPAQSLMHVVANLGAYANERKKFERNDHTYGEYGRRSNPFLQAADHALGNLAFIHSRLAGEDPSDKVDVVDPNGVDIAEAVEEKFNAVSHRVRCNVLIIDDKVERAE